MLNEASGNQGLPVYNGNAERISLDSEGNIIIHSNNNQIYYFKIYEFTFSLLVQPIVDAG